MKLERRFLIIFTKVFFIAVFPLILVLGGFEIYLRKADFLSAQPAVYPCVVGDLELNHAFEPGCEGKALANDLNTEKDVTYKVNERGFRGDLPDLSKKSIVVIGDSYTEGFGLEENETFAANLKRSLNSEINVLNGGLMGMSPAVYPTYFKKIFSEIKPKFVLLNLDFTDFSDDVYYFQIANFGENGHPIAFPARNIVPKLLQYYVSFNFSAVFRLIYEEIGRVHSIVLRERAIPVLDNYIQKKLDGSDWSEIDSIDVGDCRKAVKLVFKNVMRLHDEVKDINGKLAIHMYLPGYHIKDIPYRTQNISFVQKYDDWTRKDLSWNCLQNEGLGAAIKKMAEGQNISFYSTFEFVKNHPKNKHFFFERDAHWNSFGVSQIVHQLLRMGLKKEIEEALR